MSLSSIGPWTFDAMRGRLNIAAPTTAPLRRGMRIGRPVAQPAELTTVETAASFGAAWAKAYGYRAAVGGWGRVVDDTGTVCEGALVADVSVLIEKKNSGAVLTTVWTIIPALWWGANGRASVPVTGDSPGILPIAGPTIDTTEPETGYTVTVGFISQTYDSIVSTIQPPLAEAQREAVRRASVDLGVEMVPADQVGQARCDVGVTGEEAARDVMKLARFQVGGFGSIKIGNAVTLAPIAFADAQATWHPAVGLGGSKDTLVTVVYTARLEDNNSEDDKKDPATATTVAIVQVASVWGQWQTVESAVCNGASEGLSATVGTTSFSIDACIVTKLKTITNDLTDHTGKWVRILVRVNEMGQGSTAFSGLTSSNPKDRTKPIWYGICRGMSIHGGSGSPGAQAIYACSQVHDVLSQVFHTRWYETGQNNKSANPGRVLPFNWDNAADRSTQPLGDGDGYYDHLGADATTQAYPHRRHANTGTDTQPAAWTIGQMANVLLKTAMAQYPDGPVWLLGGEITAMDAEVTSFDGHGKSVLDMLAELISPRHSLVFRVYVSDAPHEVVVLSVQTVTPVPVVIPGLATIPANTLAAPLDLAKDGGTATVYKPFGTAGIGSALQGERFPAWNLHRDRSRQVDGIYVEGGNPWIMGTTRLTRQVHTTVTAHFVASSMYDYDFTPTQRTDWIAASVKRRADPDLAHVFRRFRLTANWDGRMMNGADTGPNVVMAMDRSLTAGNENGAFEAAPLSSENLPNPRTLKLTRCVPIPEGVDLNSSNSFGSNGVLVIPRGVHPGRPSVFGRINATGKYENLGDTLAVTVDADAGTVELGHGAEDAAFIYNYLEILGNEILITIGILGALPWRCSWRRPEAERPRNLERVIILRHPEMQYRQVLAGTIVGVNADGTARTVPSLNGALSYYADKLIDDTKVAAGDRLNLELRLARFWYEDLHRSFAWTQSGVVAFGDNQPTGQLITDVTLPLDQHRPYIEAVNAPVTARSWDFRKASLATSWECDRMAIGFDYRITRREQAGRQFPEMKQVGTRNDPRSLVSGEF